MERAAILGVDAWVERLGKTELPVVAGVVSELTSLAERSDVSASQLVDVILRDPTLTSQVMRVANNPYYQSGRAGGQVTTISRAVSQIGFSGIRAIVVSLMLIDSLFRNKPKARMLESLARSFHAAVQAKDLIRKHNDYLSEDAFTSGLLYRVGELAFWTWGGHQADALSKLIANGSSIERASEECLGTQFASITQSLAEQWQLGETLKQALREPEGRSLAAKAVVLGDTIAAASEHGWNSKEFSAALDMAVEFTGGRREEIRQRLMENAARAGEVAEGYGAGLICKFIPSAFDREGDERQAMSPDAQFQLDVLRELSELLNKRTDINTIFQVVLEGMHRGVGLERVALLILNPERTLLQTKYVLGDRLDHWKEMVKVKLDSTQPNPLTVSIKSHNPMWAQAKGEGVNLYTLTYTKLFGRNDAFIAPIYAGSRSMGVFFADRGGCGELTEVQYNNFCHFAQQANLALSLLAKH